MNWNISIAINAKRDLFQAIDYMKYVLKNPAAANRFAEEASAKINALSTFPEKFALVSDPVLASQGIRCTHIHNFLAFYILDEQSHQITIIRILYKKSCWTAILQETIND